MMDINPEKGDRRVLIAQYVDELRQLMPEATGDVAPTADNDSVPDLLGPFVKPAVAIERTKPTWPTVAALVVTLILALGEAAVLLLPPPETKVAPPAEVVALESADVCLQRQVEIMDALQRYAQDHGGLPQHLAALGPPYLLNPWIDPISGQPYEYETDTRSVSLTCPNPKIHSLNTAEARTDPRPDDLLTEGLK